MEAHQPALPFGCRTHKYFTLLSVGIIVCTWIWTYQRCVDFPTHGGAVLVDGARVERKLAELQKERDELARALEAANAKPAGFSEDDAAVSTLEKKVDYSFYEPDIPTWIGHRFQHNRIPMTPANMAAMRISLTTLLREVTALLHKHGIRYILEGGTLVGFERNGDFLPWDDDVDLRIHQEDWHKMIGIRAELTKTATGERGGVGSLEFDPRIWITWKHTGVQVFLKPGLGIDPVDGLPHLDVVRGDVRICPSQAFLGLKEGEVLGATVPIHDSCGGRETCCGGLAANDGVLGVNATYLLYHNVQSAFDKPLRRVELAGVPVTVPHTPIVSEASVLFREFGSDWRSTPPSRIPMRQLVPELTRLEHLTRGVTDPAVWEEIVRDWDRFSIHP
jgi:hypothetical protein